MTRDQFAKLLDEIQEKERAVRNDGQKEYAREEDNCFANFDRIGKMLNLSREQVLWIYFYKHIDGIVAHINGHTSQREDVRGRIKDARMYLALLWGMLDDREKWEKTSKPAMDYLDSLESGAQLNLVAPDDEDGWVYGADPLDELSIQPNMNPPRFRAGYRELPGPRYTDIVEAPKKTALAEAMCACAEIVDSVK